jgi:hypothetical protein
MSQDENKTKDETVDGDGTGTAETADTVNLDEYYHKTTR